MTKQRNWLTNDPIVAAKLKAADRQYNSDIEAARELCLADKIQAHKAAKQRQDDAYEAACHEAE